MAAEVILRDIHLHGSLGLKYGEKHRMAVDCPAEAIRALIANFPTFRHDLRESAWQVYRGDFALDEKTLGLGLGKAPLHIIPAGAGSNGGSVKLILGVVLIAASIATGQIEGVGLAGTILGGAMTVGQVAGIGAALALSGIAQIIAPNQKLNPSAAAGSNLFTGLQNTATEGTALPIVYGEMMMGSVVGSVYLSTDQQTSAYIPLNPAPETFPGIQVLIQT